MINVDIAQIEALTDLLTKSASCADDALNRLRSVSSEMINDTELPMYTQYDVLLETVALATQALNRGTDTLLTLKGAVTPVADIYRDNEKKNKDALSRMTTYVDSVNTSVSAAVFVSTVPDSEHSDAESANKKVQQLVVDSVSQMQATNIAAVAKVVNDEYEVKNINDLKSDL